MSVGVGEYVDHAGLRHGLNYAGKPRCGARMVWSNLPTVGDCRECFPESYGPSPDFSSSTLTDLQKLTDERDQARDIAVRLEQENARLTELVTDLAGHGLRADLMPTTMHWQDGAAMYSWFCEYMSRADQQLRDRCRSALAAAPVDGAE